MSTRLRLDQAREWAEKDTKYFLLWWISVLVLFALVVVIAATF
jgi:hypothetical protein